MRRRGLLLLGLWAWMVTGCLTGKPVQSTSWLRPVRPAQGSTSADIVHFDVALIETPAGDNYLNDELWTQADDQLISLEQTVLLDANGFRIGEVGGVIPARLQTLLASQRTCRDPRHIQQHAGKPTRLPLGATRATCRFQIRHEGRTSSVALEQAECALVVVPAMMPDGRTRLRFTPEVRHGQAVMVPQPDRERTMWMLQNQQPTESYAALGWEVILGPDEYLLVGGYFDRPQTLGHQCFVQTSESSSCQRLLVIRTAHAVPTDDDTAASGTDDPAAPARTWPLADQAACTPAPGRGY